MKKAFDFIKVNPLAWVVVFFGCIGLIYYAGKRSGKGAEFDERKMPDSGSGLPKNWAATEASSLVEDMRSALSVFWYHVKATGPKMLIMAKWNALTNDQLTTVANLYNDRHGKADGVSIVAAVEKQNMWPSDEPQKELSKRLRALKFS